jgi:transporter family protein
MDWILLTLSCGVFNALWTAQIKGKIQGEGAMPFTTAMRWGVGGALLPLAWVTWRPVRPEWWLFTVLAGSFECASLWTMSRGVRSDYYATFAISNVSPLFVALVAPFVLGEEIGWMLGAGTALVVLGALWMHFRGHWSRWGLASALFTSLTAMSSKVVIGQGSAIAHASLAFSLGALVFQLIGYRHPGMSMRNVSKQILLSRYLVLLSALATITYYIALQIAPVTKVSPLVRVNLIIAFLLSYYNLRERQDWQGRAFGALLLLSGLILVLWKP